MEGVGGILNFNPDRELAFDPARTLGFSPRRGLDFNPSRGLGFNQNRDLGFGRRGVVFRGYVCPICGSLATETSTRCTECGAVFEGPPRASKPGAEGPPRQDPAKKGKPSVKTPPSGKSTTVYCAYCGVILKRADTFCWNCGARADGPTSEVQLPKQTRENVTRDWRGSKGP